MKMYRRWNCANCDFSDHRPAMVGRHRKATGHTVIFAKGDSLVEYSMMLVRGLREARQKRLVR